MNHDHAAQLLDDLLDGGLDAARANEVEAHVRQCVACRREMETRRQLREMTAALPRDIEPAFDLWPAIAGEIEAEPAGFGERLLARLRLTSWSWPTALATTALLALLLPPALEDRPLLQTGPATAAASLPADADPEAAAVVQVLEAECRQCEAELEAYTASGRDQTGLVARMLERNMPVVDRAIAEAREAWLESPGEPRLARLLASAYRAKMSLQKKAIDLTSET
jgi:anti-sigma factor RsiW